MVAQKPHSTNQDIFCSELLWLNWDITISNQSYLSAKEFVRCIDSGLSRLVYVYGFCCGLPRAYSSVLGLVAQCTLGWAQWNLRRFEFKFDDIVDFPHRGPFNNYVDKILTFFDHLPISTWTSFTLNVDKMKQFLTTYPPHLVHVVFEWPLV